MGVFNKTIILLALVGYEMIIANSALRASLAIYHLISFGAKICTDICPWTLSVPRSSQFSSNVGKTGRSRKTVRFSEQIMSADKYPCIFSCQMAAIVYLYHAQQIW